MNSSFVSAVLAASQRSEVRDAVGAIYQSLQEQIDQRRPVCRSSGKCCKFDEYGHRLYITTAEMATFLHRVRFDRSARRAPDIGPGGSNSLKVLSGCPFQVDGLCSVHGIRPFGCRIFFCDASSTQWQQEQYELFHRRLKQIHEHLEVPYFYMEWRSALSEVQIQFSILPDSPARLQFP